jgi:uncharacterized membrane protein YraQ (UPF0718 family)
MNNKKLLIIIGLIIISPLLLIMLFLSFRIWPLWLLLIIIGGVILFFRKTNIPDTGGMTGQLKGRMDSFFIRLNNSINSGSFKNFTRKLFLYPLIGIITIALIAIAAEFLLADYFKATNTKKEMSEIAEALNKYKYHQNKYPEDLQELIGNNPLKKEWLNDQWGHPYKYSVSASGPVLVSLGKDGKEGTDDDLSFNASGEISNE